MNNFWLPDAPEVLGDSITLQSSKSEKIRLKTEVTVDSLSTCEGAEHTSQGWHLYWITDSNEQRVRIVRMCPKRAADIQRSRELKPAREERNDDWRNR